MLAQTFWNRILRKRYARPEMSCEKALALQCSFHIRAFCHVIECNLPEPIPSSARAAKSCLPWYPCQCNTCCAAYSQTFRGLLVLGALARWARNVVDTLEFSAWRQEKGSPYYISVLYQLHGQRRPQPYLTNTRCLTLHLSTAYQTSQNKIFACMGAP
jgi:hypothetical protein